MLITTQNLGKTTVNELASAMGKVIPTANASKRVKYWGQKTIEVRQALRDWNAGDTKRYGKLE